MTEVAITATTAVILRAMVKEPKTPRYVHLFAEELGIAAPTVRTTFRRLEDAGWLSSWLGPRTRHQARRYYTFTPEGLKAARAELKSGWVFTDAQS